MINNDELLVYNSDIYEVEENTSSPIWKKSKSLVKHSKYEKTKKEIIREIY